MSRPSNFCTLPSTSKILLKAMGAYTPAEFPRRPKNSNVFSEVHYQWQLAYYRYEINTGLYVMSGAEKTAFNLVVLSLLALSFAAVYYCLPKTAAEFLKTLAFYVTGSYRLPNSEILAAPDLAYRIFQGSREVAASTTHGGGSSLNESNVLGP